MTLRGFDASPHGDTEIAMAGIADHIPKLVVS